MVTPPAAPDPAPDPGLGATDSAPLARGNPRLKRLRRLATRRDERDTQSLLVLEGPTLVGEALDAAVTIEHLFHEEGRFDELAARARAAGVSVDPVAAGVLASLLTTVTPQPVAAIARRASADLATVARAGRAGGLPVVVLAGVADPGNAGGLLRTAEAAGVAGVVFADSSVDPYSPKVVRASAGAVLRVPIVAGGATIDLLDALAVDGTRVVGTARTGGRTPDALDLARPVALVLGNEAHGLPSAIDDRLDDVVSIPMAGAGESLNVAVAGAVTLFEAARQRRTGSAPPGAAELISRVSHELRSPLTSVKGFSGVLVNRWDRLADEKKHAMVVDINREADRLSRMITELLELSRIESGRLRLDVRSIDVAHLVAVGLERVQRDHPHLQVAVDLANDLPPVVGDADRLERIVVNLLENAAKYGEGSDVRVTVVGDGHVVSLTVSDSGAGLAADEVDTIFQPHDRLGGGRPSGTGLGLWLSRAVAEAHGGALTFESTGGVGTRVTLSLPHEAPVT